MGVGASNLESRELWRGASGRVFGLGFLVYGLGLDVDGPVPGKIRARAT